MITIFFFKLFEEKKKYCIITVRRRENVSTANHKRVFIVHNFSLVANYLRTLYILNEKHYNLKQKR